MTDILFTHSYFLRFDTKEERVMRPYPPLATITAAAFLRSRGFRVALHDVMFSGDEMEIVPQLTHHRPRLLVVYDDGFNYLTKMCLSRMRTAAFRLAEIGRAHGCQVIVCSSDAGDHLAEYFDHGVDVVIVGEGEQTLADVAATQPGNGESLREIEGIAFRRRDEIIRTQPRKVMRNLDAFPIAAWDLVDVERYRRAWKSRHGMFSLNISTTRGCPYHCNWCAKPIYGQVYNSRSPQSVVDELLLLKRTAKPDHIWMTDDIFGLKPGWIGEFSRLVSEQGAKIPFKCLSRADLLVNGDTVSLLKDAGCTAVWIGAESGSQKVLDAMEKGITLGDIRASVRVLRGKGLRVGFFLQFGYPGETWADIQQTMGLVRECLPDEIGVSVSYPLPGTRFYDRVKDQLGVKQNWVVSEDLDMLFAGMYSRRFYRTLHTVVHKRFGIWRGLRAVRRLARRPFASTPRDIRFATAMVYHLITLLPYVALLLLEKATPPRHATVRPRPALARS